MSTILRALQKIEKDTTEETEQLGPYQPIKASNTISRRLTTLWYLQLGKRFILIGSGLAVASLIVFLMINVYNKADNSSLSSNAAQSRTQSRLDDPQKPVPHMIPSSETEKSKSAAQRPGPTRPKSYAPEPTYDPNHRPDRYADNSTSKTFPQETIYRPKNSVEPPLETETISPGYNDEDLYDDPYEDEEPQAPVEILENDPEELRYAQVNLLEDGVLELQAISWAQTPSQSIAVINSEIMHQGQMIEGYKVVYIGPDQVVVEKGGEQWKIIFMVR